MAKQSGLGKGLSSLIPEDTINSIQQAYIPALPIDKIIPNQYQPRVEIDPSKLVELSDSLREHGVIEPLLVTQNSPDEFELIAGERRWRASKLAGLETVPVVVKEASPQQMLELAIVENIQREDLNPIEEAMAFSHLAQKFDLTHSDIAKKVGYSRPAVANKIRLLQLSNPVKKLLIQGSLSEGHARSLLGLDSEEAIEAAARVVVRDNLSVRATEELVKKLKEGHQKSKKTKSRPLPKEYRSIESELKSKFSTKVSISLGKRGGKIVIPFKDESELDKYKEIFLG